MPEVTIAFPKGGMPPIKGSGFIATGIANPDLIGVVGTCKARSGGGYHDNRVRGTLIDFRLLTAGSNKGKYSWAILFVLPPAAYELKVVGHSEAGPAGDPACVDVEVIAAAVATGTNPLDITNIIPPAGADITSDLCGGTFSVMAEVSNPTIVKYVRLASRANHDDFVSSTNSAVMFGSNLFAQFDPVTEHLNEDTLGGPDELDIVFLDKDKNSLGEVPVTATLPCEA